MIKPRIPRNRFSTYFNDWQTKIQRRNEFLNISESLSLLYYTIEDGSNHQGGVDFLNRYRELAKQLSAGTNLSLENEELVLKSPNEALNRQEQEQVEQATKSQSNSTLWNALRVGRITASRAGYCYRMSPDLITPGKLWRSVPPNAAMNHGKLFEPLGIEALAKRHNLEILESGFWIDTKRPWLGVTPDGLIYGEQGGNLNAVVEIKCPYSAKMDTIENWKLTSNSCLGLDGLLKPKHDYYYQIQMQMAITNTKTSLFGVYTGVDLHSEWITFDQNLWDDMLVKFDLLWKKLDQFNKDAIV